MANTIIRFTIQRIKNSRYFCILLDKFQDISVEEQMTICFRYIDKEFQVHEEYAGLYNIPRTDAESLFKVVEGIFAHFNLSHSDCKGQCFDCAANMAGLISGLQKRIKEKEPIVIFIHCMHSLNSGVHDAIQNVNVSRDFSNMIKELINFV